ncbi:MAG: TIGR03960 family B12-binding radical SAM protein, partial [Acidobacteriota bacterium]
MSWSNDPYADFIDTVAKPARYIGGEHQSIVKNWDDVDAKLALCFPDVYDIGMSHLGTKILYSVVNGERDLCLERVFCPWLDMERELRQRGLPLVSLETHRPLSKFDMVGFSLQYELTFTNILTMLDLGGIPLHNHERTWDDPLVIAGGPVATQPEPVAAFIDAFLIGDAEERLPRLMRHYAGMKREGKLSRTEMLVKLAKEGGVYCPDLYHREICSRSGRMVVSRPKYPGVPKKVKRALVRDINRYRFPDDSPVPVAEAIFDRMAIEVARGCTEGCRFCQAGMIYRPVRERDPEEVIDTLVSAIEKGGYDEAAVTSLSMADYSCVSPLIKKAMERLRPKKISLGISSLRAYGLGEDLLDDIASVKATGLTFAPEAGTQRMRNVINKNVTEEDIFTTCHRVFSRGWNKVKLYFMIGQPTEKDE